MLGPGGGATAIDMLDVGVAVADMKDGFPTLQRTGGDITVIGAMLNVAVAVNCTCPLAKFWASTAAGVTIKLCITRVDVMAVVPPQPVMKRNKRTLRTVRVRIADRAIRPPALPPVRLVPA
jgi:hypothetical protein